MNQIPIIAVRDAIASAALHDLSKQAAEMFTATEPNIAISRDAYSQVIQRGVPNFPEVWADRINDMLIAESRPRNGNKFQFGLRELNGDKSPVELSATTILDRAHEEWTVIHLPDEEIIKWREGPIFNIGKTDYQIQITFLANLTDKDEVSIGIISRSGDETRIKEAGIFARKDITQQVLQELIPNGKNILISDFAEVMTALRAKQQS